MAASSTSVSKVYRSVIDDVISNMREAFLDEGVDEQVLIELKQIWENKLVQSKAVDSGEPKNDPPAPVVSNQRGSSDQRSNSTTHITTNRGTTQSIGPAGIVQPTVLQYAPQAVTTDGQKTLMVQMPIHSINSSNGPQKVTITLPAHMGQPGLTTVMSAPGAAATLALPHFINQGIPGHQNIISTAPDGQQIQYQTVAVTQANTSQANNTQAQQNANPIVQLDGANDTSDEDEDDFNDEDQNDDGDDDQLDEENDEDGEEEEPLNSEDDVSDEDPSDLFDTDNVVVCQYDKITRCRNKWKFHLKDGIMSLKGKDYVFHKSVGDAEW